MRILILTQPIGHNYGGILQAYALQRFLRNLGHQVQTTEYRVDMRRYLLKKLIREPRRMVRDLHRDFFVTPSRKIPRHFIKQRIALSKTHYPIPRCLRG
jgi:hypothetical protein